MIGRFRRRPSVVCSRHALTLTSLRFMGYKQIVRSHRSFGVRMTNDRRMSWQKKKASSSSSRRRKNWCTTGARLVIVCVWACSMVLNGVGCVQLQRLAIRHDTIADGPDRWWHAWIHPWTAPTNSTKSINNKTMEVHSVCKAPIKATLYMTFILCSIFFCCVCWQIAHITPLSFYHNAWAPVGRTVQYVFGRACTGHTVWQMPVNEMCECERKQHSLVVSSAHWQCLLSLSVS